MFVALLLSLIFLLPQCAQDAVPTNKKGKNSANGGIGSEAASEFKKSLAAIQLYNDQLSLEKTLNSFLQSLPRQIAQQQAIQQALCARYKEYRAVCPISARLFGEKIVLGCDTITQANNIDGFTVSFVAPAPLLGAKFYLQARYSWETQPFVASATELETPLIWKRRTGLPKNSIAPRIMDMQELRLRGYSSSFNFSDYIYDNTNIKFRLKYNGKILADKLAFFNPNSSVQAEYVLDKDLMDSYRKQTVCSVTSEEIGVIIDDAVKKFNTTSPLTQNISGE